MILSQKTHTAHLSFRAPKLGALAVGLLMFSACRSAPRSAGAPGPSRVRVLVYNIHAGKDATLHDNIERVSALVKETRADVVLLQEVDRRTRRSGGADQPALLAAATGLHVAFGRTLDYDGGEYGIAMLSRWPIRDDTLIHLPIDPPQARAGGSYEPRGALRATLETPFGPLTAINTHLDASGDDRWRLQEIRTLLAIGSDATKRGERWVLVGGDFNSTPESAIQVQVRAGGWRDSWTECGSGAGLTYPADSSVKRIDYLLLGAGTRCTAAQVLANQASDHRGVLFDVVLER